MLTDELIQDRIVCGIHNDAVCAQLLREKNLTLESAIRICMLFECAERGTKKLKREKCLQCSSTEEAVTIAGASTLLSATNARLSANAATHATSQTIQTLGTATLVLSGGQLLFHTVDRNVKSLLGLPDSMRLNLIQQQVPEI